MDFITNILALALAGGIWVANTYYSWELRRALRSYESTLKQSTALRPCTYINCSAAGWSRSSGWFHQWRIHGVGCQSERTFGVVETKDGQIIYVHPNDIIFTDRRPHDYAATTD